MVNIEFVSLSKDKWYEQIPWEFFLQLIPGLGFIATIWFWGKLTIMQKIICLFISALYSALTLVAIIQLFK